MRKICVALLLLLLSVPAVWADTQDTTVFKAIMSPDNEVPVVSAPGNSGFATITIRVTRDTKTGLINAATVIFDIDYTVPTATTFTGLHIHNSLPGTSGGVVINTGVTNVAGGNSISVAAGSGHITKVVNYSTADTLGQTGLGYVTGLLDMPENYYVNIHSTVQGSGLMRAPLLRTSWTFRPQMTPAQVVPPNAGLDAEGAATIQVLVNRNNAGTITSGTVVFDVDYRIPGGSTITGLQIRNAAAASNGPSVIDTGINVTGRSITTASGRGNIFRIADIPSTDSPGLAALTGIMNDPTQFYVNLNSFTFPTGLIRGQLSRDTYAFFGQMTTAEEVPAPTATNPASVANTMTIVKVTRDNTGNITNGTVSFNVAYSGFDAPTTFTGLHIHNGVFGQSAGVVINTGLGGQNTVLAPTGSGSVNRDVIVESTSLQAAQDALKGLLQNPELYYVNIHSSVNTGGAIRTQLAREVYHFRTLMSPANEVPPVSASTSATGWVTVKIARDPGTLAITGGQVTFDVDAVSTGPTTYTGLHIHTGSAAVSGTEVISSGITATNNVDSPTGSLNITRVVNIASTDPANVLTMLGTLINNPDQAYIDLHTTVNPLGLERSQMLPVLNYVPQVAGGGDWISSITINNPSATTSVNGIVDTFQSNGTAMSTAFVDPNISFLIPPGGSTTINLHNKGTLTAGFVRVYSSSAVTLNASYSYPALSMTAAVTPVTSRMATVPVTIGPNFTNTGIAILNQTDGQLILTLRDNGLGQIIAGGTSTINVTAGQHVVAFLTELLPNVTLPAFSGTLTIENRATTGTGQLTAIALQFDGTLSPVTITPIP